MKLYNLFFILVFITYYSLGQKTTYIPIRSFDGRVLVTVDSLSFRDEHLASQYYIDSLTGEPYTGGAIIDYAGNALDSLSIVNGLKNGWQRMYFSADGECCYLGQLKFYDQHNRVNISYPLQSPLKNKSAFARYYTDTTYYFHEIIYKSSGRIIVKQTVWAGSQKKKRKIKFSTLHELDCFFSHHEPIYQYCKQAGFFEEP